MYGFRRELTQLGNVLMPFARAIKCLEAKHTTAADVYMYWLAIVRQLSDLMTRNNSKASKHETSVKEKVRAIVNFRFAQLINNAARAVAFSRCCWEAAG